MDGPKKQTDSWTVHFDTFGQSRFSIWFFRTVHYRSGPSRRVFFDENDLFGSRLFTFLLIIFDLTNGVSHITFHFKRFEFSDTFQPQLHFSKFILTLQLKPEFPTAAKLSNSNEIFQYQKKLSNFPFF